jgi:putative hemolysin
MICKVFFELDDQLIIDDILNIRNVSFKETYNKDIIDTWEEYDKKSYHFTIYDNDLLVGYYRLRRFDNNFNDTLASQLFNLENFSYFDFCEISRACVNSNYRDGSVISLLWTNISSFLLMNNIEQCIGCTSIINDQSFLVNSFSYILNKNLIFKDLILPKNKIKIEQKLDEEHIKKRFVTTLIRAYGKQGALFSPWPSLDNEWNTIDFFTVFNVKDLTKRFSKMA